MGRTQLLVHLIRSGEATGDVTTMLDRAAEDEACEFERRTMFLTSLLEPLLILAMGGVVLVIVLAVVDGVTGWAWQPSSARRLSRR